MVDNAIRVGDEVAEALRRGPARGGAGEHDHRPRPAQPSQRRGRGADRADGPRPRRRAGHDRHDRRHGRGRPGRGADTASRHRRRRGEALGTGSGGRRDQGADGATTVASTAALAARAGINVFATGGLGGVHRGASESYDESADLTALSRTPILVVCAGVKSILDVGATLERLETLGRHGRSATAPAASPASTSPTAASTWTGTWTRRRSSPRPCAAGTRSGSAPGAIVVSNPLPFDVQLDPDLHDRVLEEGLDGACPRGDHRQGRDAVPAGPLPRGDRTGRAWRSTSRSSCATPPWPPRSPRRTRPHDRRPVGSVGSSSSATSSPTSSPSTPRRSPSTRTRRPDQPSPAADRPPTPPPGSPRPAPPSTSSASSGPTPPATTGWPSSPRRASAVDRSAARRTRRPAA